MSPDRRAPHEPPDLGGPWFRRRPTHAVLVAVVMFSAVFALRVTNASDEDAVSVLYVLPVALLALAFGLRGGLGASIGAVALLGTGVVIMDVDMTPAGWVLRVAPLLLLGALTGFASDQAREAERRRRRYASAMLLQREAAEINDGIVQGLAAAKWLLEAGHIDRGVEAVNDTMIVAQSLVTRMLSADGPLEAGRLRSQPVRQTEAAPGS